MSKTLIGPQLRQLRRKHRHTQAEMADRLGISPAYVNLLESNQRSLSVQVLMALSDAYGVDPKTLVQDQDAVRLADLRAAVRDPMFGDGIPDLQELRGAIDHAPQLVDRFLDLHAAHQALTERVTQMAGADSAQDLLDVSPETAVHNVFRRYGNHFDALDQRAEDLRARIGGTPDDMYALLKRHLRLEHGIQCSVRYISDMPDALRVFDRDAGHIYLSEALDPQNRIFQLAHVLALTEAQDDLSTLVEAAAPGMTGTRDRLKIELANYFAAALLMPYGQVLSLAETTRYDIDRIAAGFGVSFEMVCHRLTTLQRDGARGIPFFFLRVDRAGNVTKRFNATDFTLAEKGGSCPVWDLHGAFRMPGVIVPQFVELPDGGQFFTLSRTSDRPVFSRRTQDRRLVVAIGCEARHADRIGYARPYNLQDRDLFAPIGIHCRICPRQSCSQRAHQPLHISLPLNTDRRGQTRWES